MGKPYEKREAETEPAFVAVAAYRDMGAERSQDKLADKLNKNVSLIAKWSRTHEWRKRVHAYDLEVDRRQKVGDLKGVEDMRRRQMRMALMAQDVANLELAKMLKESKRRQDANTIDQPLILKLLDLGTRLERLNRGEPGEIVERTGGDAMDYSLLSTEQLRELKGIRATLRQGREAPEEESTDG